MRDVAAYLAKRKEGVKDEAVAEKWRQLEEHYQKKLWHQLTVDLKTWISDPVFTKDLNLLDLYQNLVADFEHRINPVSLVQIVMPVARNIPNPGEAAKFLEKIKDTVKNDDQAVVLCLVGMAENLLRARDAQGHCLEIQRVKQIVGDASDLLDKVVGITPTHAAFYKVSSEYLREMGDYSGFYKEALRLLGCSNVAAMSQDEKYHHALCLALAAVLGQDVYNFGELLAHPILQALSNSPNKWLVDLLYAFNSGDLARFETLRPHWQTQPDLVKHQEHMQRKIRLLCLMEIAFARPANRRQLTFAEIATAAKLQHGEVEHLVMKALSIGLVRGYIDQVDERVDLTWVQPRVLDKQQIKNLSVRVEDWAKIVGGLQQIAEHEAEEILTH